MPERELAIRTELSGVAALPSGGTTGQALTKNSNTNGDVHWATISGGGVTSSALTAPSSGINNFTISASSGEQLFLCDCTLGYVQASLPSASANKNGILCFRKIDTSFHDILLKPGTGSGELLDGVGVDGNGWFPRTMNNQWDTVTIVSDGTNWYRLNHSRSVPGIYFVDATNGNDSFTGLSPQEAKQTISAAVGSYRTVFIGKGVYTETVDLSGIANCRLIGCGIGDGGGNGVTIRAPSDTTSALTMANGLGTFATNCEVAYLALRGKNGSTTYTGSVCVGGYSECYMHDLSIQGIGDIPTVQAGTYGGVGLDLGGDTNLFKNINVNQCNIGVREGAQGEFSGNTLERIEFGTNYKAWWQDDGTYGGNLGGNVYTSFKADGNGSPTASGVNVVELHGCGIYDMIDLAEQTYGTNPGWLIACNGAIFRMCTNAGTTHVLVTGNDNCFENWSIQETFTVQSGAARNTFRQSGNATQQAWASITDNGTNTRYQNWYNTGTFGTNPIWDGSRIMMSAAPASGGSPYGGQSWRVGDIVWNSAPASAGFIGWVCTVAGSPGTWKTFGAIS